MLQVMMNSPVGDDVFGEDETVTRLQEECAKITGKEKSLFVPSGCMANQLAIKSHTNPGDEVICEAESHIFNYETAAPSVISNVQMMIVPGENGILDVEKIRKYIRTSEYYFPRTRLISLENTHNRAGGVIQPIEKIKKISEFAKENNLRLHLDGARIFNAYVETKIMVKEYASYFDSIAFCFSKGLGCPVGSVLCGGENFIDTAHKWRKILGGGMRQAGILAGAALYALDNNIERLIEDHQKADYFSKEISKMNGVRIDLDTVQTNIVVFSAEKFTKNYMIEQLKEKGVLISSGSYDNLRVVFHKDVSKEDVEIAVGELKSLFNG
jgi:threonine aldolase